MRVHYSLNVMSQENFKGFSWSFLKKNLHPVNPLLPDLVLIWPYHFQNYYVIVNELFQGAGISKYVFDFHHKTLHFALIHEFGMKNDAIFLCLNFCVINKLVWHSYWLRHLKNSQMPSDSVKCDLDTKKSW